SGQIGENYFRARPSGPAHFEKVNAAGASRRGTGAGEFGFDQRIDDAGLADVRTAQKGDFGQAGRREVSDIRPRRQESRHDPHSKVCNAADEFGKWSSRSLALAKLLAQCKRL